MKHTIFDKMLLLLVISAALVLAFTGCSEKKKSGKVNVVFSGPEGMTMSYKGKSLEGLNRKLPPGNYIFKFTAPGCKPMWKEINISNADHQSTIEIGMEAERSAVLVRCTTEDPQKDGNVTVYLNGEEQGITPCLITGIPIGTHTLQLSHPGYAGKTRQIKITDSRPLPQIKESLSSISGILRVTGAPSGAMLYIDEKLAGPIPYQAKYTAGKYLLELRAPGYISQKQEINLQANTSNKAEIILKPEPSSIYIESVPANAVCVVRGEKQGTTPLLINNLQPGNYKIELSLPGYDDVEEMVEVKAGSHERLKIAMESGFGFARLNIRPAGVDVYVDGKLIGRTRQSAINPQQTEPILLKELLPGSHSCTISHPKAKPRTTRKFNFMVAKNKTTECPIVEMWVADCEITYNNGLQEEVKLIRMDDREVEFSLQPGISMREKRTDVRIRRLDPR